MKKRIVVYVDSLNASGGIERIVSQLIDKWKVNYDILIVTKDEGECFYPGTGGVSRISLHTPRIVNMESRMQRIIQTFVNSLRSMRALRRLMKKMNYSFLYVTTPMNAFEAYYAGTPGRKIIVSEHGSSQGINKIYRIIKKIIYPKVNCISVPNKYDTMLYKKSGYNALYIPHIVQKKQNTPNSLRSKVILNVGRLTADKRQYILIEAWSRLKNKKGWKLIIVGDGEEKDRLDELIHKYRLDDSVFLKPATKDIDSYYRNASIFAFSSRFEGFGLVLVEAMSFGIPCVSFDCPSGPRDIIKNGINGYLVKNNEIDEYSNVLEKMIDMNELELQKMGQNAYKTVARWNNDLILEKWDAVFNGR